MRCVVALVLLIGCADASKQIEKLADRACACTEAACAETVLDDFVAFAKANPAMSGDQDDAIKQAKRLSECSTKAGVPLATLMAKMKAVQAAH
ncbi:MAG TPA: hypothetical protein VH143_30410 [Kofleriaceae bacterium]|nr:hypothetical protein [Kofleriaceae bacterium]